MGPRLGNLSACRAGIDGWPFRFCSLCLLFRFRGFCHTESPISLSTMIIDTNLPQIHLYSLPRESEAVFQPIANQYVEIDNIHQAIVIDVARDPLGAEVNYLQDNSVLTKRTEVCAG